MNLQQIRSNGQIDIHNPPLRITAFLLTLFLTACITIALPQLLCILLGDSQLHTLSATQGLLWILTITLAFEWFAETYIDKEQEPTKID